MRKLLILSVFCVGFSFAGHAQQL